VQVRVKPHLRNLLTRMLTKLPADRCVLADVIDHEWVTMEGARPLDKMFEQLGINLFYY
jgi:hypothetical protein